ncbi:MAG: histidine kinase dimerization/phospho-acceptor domain-containing protein, partial [Spirochaetota bacterium]
MSIKYKLILLFIAVICAASLPLSFFTLALQENEKIRQIQHQGEVNSLILARSAASLVLMNGGDLYSSRVDAADMISRYKLFSGDGLIFADVVLISSRQGAAPSVLSSIGFSPHGRSVIAFPSASDNSGFREISVPGEGLCYEFVSREPVSRVYSCAARMIYSENDMTSSIRRIRRIVIGCTFGAVLLVCLMGLAFSRLISRPAEDMIEGVRQLESGNYDINIKARSHDELGRLAVTFNHLARILHLQITELRKSNVQLKKIDQMKDEFMANISHELRSPLYGMIGIAESLSAGSDGEMNPDAVHDLSLIVHSGKRLSSLVNDLLDFSKIQHRDLSIAHEPVDMYSISQHAVMMLAPS